MLSLCCVVDIPSQKYFFNIVDAHLWRFLYNPLDQTFCSISNLQEDYKTCSGIEDKRQNNILKLTSRDNHYQWVWSEKHQLSLTCLPISYVWRSKEFFFLFLIDLKSMLKEHNKESWTFHLIHIYMIYISRWQKFQACNFFHLIQNQI